MRELQQYEHRRVTATGITYPGGASYIDVFDVHSIGPSEMSEFQIRDLIEELRHNHWKEPVKESSPTSWAFNVTSPMLETLQAGPSAQDILLKYVDPQIKDQIIILLGGVGDQKAVGPIIHAMGMVCMLMPTKAGLNLGIAYAMELPDLAKCLEGTGKLDRHVKLKSKADLETAALKSLLKAAVARREKTARKANK